MMSSAIGRQKTCTEMLLAENVAVAPVPNSLNCPVKVYDPPEDVIVSGMTALPAAKPFDVFPPPKKPANARVSEPASVPEPDSAKLIAQPPPSAGATHWVVTVTSTVWVPLGIVSVTAGAVPLVRVLV